MATGANTSTADYRDRLGEKNLSALTRLLWTCVSTPISRARERKVVYESQNSLKWIKLSQNFNVLNEKKRGCKERKKPCLRMGRNRW